MALESSAVFENWLQDQRREHCILVAARAAARVFPFTTPTHNPKRSDAQTSEQLVLSTARCIITAGVSAVSQTPEIRRAARAAADAARVTDIANATAATAFAADAARAAADAARATDTAYTVNSAAFATDTVNAAAFAAHASQTSAFADRGLEFSALIVAPIWEDPVEPNWLVAACPEENRLIHQGAEWSFWREWYQGFLDGKPLDWELQRRVALIPDVDWDKGPEHIAGVIEKIRLQFKTQTTPALVRDEKREMFKVESDDPLPRDVLEFSCARIAATYEDAINASSENGFREDSYEASLIQRALSDFASHPSLLATSFFDACLSFQRTIGERYPEDTSLINLQNALYGVVEEINEQHEDARNRCARLAKLAQPEPISMDDFQALKEVPDMVADQVDAQAGQIIESDVERMLSTPNPPKSVRSRFTNWITTISMWMDKAMKGDKRAQWLAGFVGRLIKWWSGGE